MNARFDFLVGKLSEFLSRKMPPGHLARDDQGKARLDEVQSLGRTIARIAPKAGYEDWWPRFEDALERSMRTRVWPNAHEIGEAAKRIPNPDAAASRRVKPADLNEEIKRAAVQLMVNGDRAIVAHLVTVDRLLAIGMSPQEAAGFNARVRSSEAWHEAYRSNRGALPDDEVRRRLGMTAHADAPVTSRFEEGFA